MNNHCADIGNEDLRAQVKTLQYELESFKQERDLTNLRHEKELRDAQAKAEADFKRAQVRLIFHIVLLVLMPPFLGLRK